MPVGRGFSRNLPLTLQVSYGTGSAHLTPVVVEQAVTGPVLLANALPRLSSHPTTTSSTATTLPAQLMGAVSLLGAASPGDLSQAGGSNAPGPPDAKKSPLTVDTSQAGGEGPPTPTHSEVPECSKGNQIKKSHRIGLWWVCFIAVVAPPPTGSPPTGSLPPMQGVSSSLQALRPQGPTITPSLANHYRDDLVNHVRGWPAEILEKQVGGLPFC